MLLSSLSQPAEGSLDHETMNPDTLLGCWVGKPGKAKSLGEPWGIYIVDVNTLLFRPSCLPAADRNKRWSYHAAAAVEGGRRGKPYFCFSTTRSSAIFRCNHARAILFIFTGQPAHLLRQTCPSRRSLSRVVRSSSSGEGILI